MPLFSLQKLIDNVNQAYAEREVEIRAQYQPRVTKEQYEKELEDWRDICRSLVSDLHAAGKTAQVLDVKYNSFRFPYMPRNPQAEIRDNLYNLERNLQEVNHDKKRVMTYLNSLQANESGAVSLTNAELKQIGLVK